MSARFTIAAALADGNALPAQYADERLNDPELVELARRIELVPDAKLDGLYPADYPGWVEVAGPMGAWSGRKPSIPPARPAIRAATRRCSPNTTRLHRKPLAKRVQSG